MPSKDDIVILPFLDQNDGFDSWCFYWRFVGKNKKWLFVQVLLNPFLQTRNSSCPLAFLSWRISGHRRDEPSWCFFYEERLWLTSLSKRQKESCFSFEECCSQGLFTFIKRFVEFTTFFVSSHRILFLLCLLRILITVDSAKGYSSWVATLTVTCVAHKSSEVLSCWVTCRWHEKKLWQRKIFYKKH